LICLGGISYRQGAERRRRRREEKNENG